MRIKLVERWSDYPPGQIIDIPASLAEALMADGIAITACEAKTECAMLDAAETAVIDSPRKRPRGRPKRST